MGTPLTWDEVKRQANLAKHGLDFKNAGEVLDSRYRLDIPMVRNGEARIQSLAYVMKRLTVLTVVHTSREGKIRVISFRRASENESRFFYEWIGKETD